MIKKLKFCINRYRSISNLKDLITFLTYRIRGTHVIRLETSSICQLRCVTCPTGLRLTKNRVVGWGYLKFDDFKKFVDENPKIKRIELSNWGEIFLNPELKDIIKYGYLKGISLTAGNGVNLNTISEEMIECIVKYQLRPFLKTFPKLTVVFTQHPSSSPSQFI